MEKIIERQEAMPQTTKPVASGIATGPRAIDRVTPLEQRKRKDGSQPK